MPAPNFNAIGINGNKFTLDSLKGKVVLIDIWATNCAPCIKAIPESNKLQSELNDKPFVSVNICMNSVSENWKKLITKHKWQGIHVYSMNDAELYLNYHFKSFPQYILLDKEGNIIELNSEMPGNDSLKKKILKLL